ncbi:MAG: hypothetical protein ACC726_15010 [Chloroflexota bacterium]
MAMEFLVEDQGDGWWHCPTPLRCIVVDGPAPLVPPRPDTQWPETYWLVRTDPPIEWNGDMRFAARWGADHPLCRPIAPTSFALIMASSPWSGPIDPDRAGSVPVYPVLGAPSRVTDAEPLRGLGVKAAVLASLR